MPNSKDEKKFEKRLNDMQEQMNALHKAHEANAKVLTSVSLLLNLCAKKLEITDVELKSAELYHDQENAQGRGDQSEQAQLPPSDSGSE